LKVVDTRGQTRVLERSPLDAFRNKKPVLFSSEKSPLIATHIHIFLKVAQTITDSIQSKMNLIIYVHLYVLNVLISPSFKDGFYFRDKKNVGWQMVR